jgi:hypothetical protein
MNMQMRAMGPGAGWRWLMQGINLGRNNPKAIFGAAALLLLIALVPTAIQLMAQFGLKMTSASALYGLVGLSMAYSLLVMPPMLGGYLRVIDASENGRATRATAIFDVFRSGQGASRMILLALLLTLIAVAVIGLILVIFGPGVAGWYLQLITASQGAGAGTPPTLPPLPDGFGTVVILVTLFGLFVQGVYAIAFGQVSLTGRSVVGALSDGLAGALKNLLPLLVLLVVWIVFAVALLLVVILLVMLLGVIGGLVHPALGIALAAPVYLAFLVVLYVVIFGVMYHLWRDVAGSDTPARQDNNIVAA